MGYQTSAQSVNLDRSITKQISNSTEWSDDGNDMAVSVPSPLRHLPRQQGYRNLFEGKRLSMSILEENRFLRVSEIVTLSP
jgi:hypothetical protein